MNKPSSEGVVDPLTRELLLGNEAIAWGAVKAGVRVVAGYPGTPSSEVLSTLAQLAAEYGYYVEWSVNEKVGLEVAAGAAYAGARSLVTMKQVGLNVAADPLMTLAYIGVRGGMVIVSADDPGPHSSQNEQDTRAFARMAKLPVLEPADAQEAMDLTVKAFEISEELGLPVVLRPTTRVCHGSGPVHLERPERPASPPEARFERKPSWVIFPALARKRHEWLAQRQIDMAAMFAAEPFLRRPGSSTETAPLGLVCSGVSRVYAREAAAGLGMCLPMLEVAAFPPNEDIVRRFIAEHREVLVIEEGDPVLEDAVRGAALDGRIDAVIHGRGDGSIPIAGELNVDIIRRCLARDPSPGAPPAEPAVELPIRPPVLCPGCPHRASFHAWKEVARRKDAVFTGDIGCYTLGNAPPLDALDTCLCMGASFTLAQGLWRADSTRPHVAFLGDSTFFHTGIPGMINAVYNNARIVMVVLDNGTTAMTGNQPHPGVGRTVTGAQTPALEPAAVARACGVGFVREVDPYDFKQAVQTAREALEYPGPALVVMRRACPTMSRWKSGRVFSVNPDKCRKCNICLDRFGCPAMSKVNGIPVIGDNCGGCGVCAQICPAAAIEGVDQ